MDIRKKLKMIWLAIHRGEEIIFNYKLISGKTIVGRITKPIDIDNRMTLFGLDNWNGVSGIENAYKIYFMSEIEVKRTTTAYVNDQYDPNRSILKKRPLPHTYDI